MKHRKIAAGLTAALLLLTGCEAPAADIPDTPAPAAPEDIPTEAYTAYPLSDFAWQTVEPESCIRQKIPSEEAVRIYAEAQTDEGSAVILSTKTNELFAALREESGFTAFYRIGSCTDAYAGDAVMESFRNVLGHNGLRLSHTVGANAANILYFTFDGAPEILVACNKSARACGPYLTEVYGSMGIQMNLYAEKDGTVYRCSLDREAARIFPDAGQMYLYDARRHRYGEQDLLLLIDIQTPKARRYAGWITDGALCLIDEADMCLPPYAYTETELPAEGKGYDWILERMETDFVLRNPADPAALSGDALKAYMDEAYTAGRGVLFLYAVAPDLMFGGTYVSGDTKTYYVAGTAYHDMQNPAFPSLSAWETYMRRILSGEMTDALITDGTFIEVDGRLYGRMGARGTNIRMRDAGSEAVRTSETEIVYRRLVDILKDDLKAVEKTECHEFIYAKTADGWRWTQLYVYN